MSGHSAEKDAPCCAHPKCPGGSLCCCPQTAEKGAGLTEAERETLDERIAGDWWGYYIHFEPTGVPEIDRLLSAVGLAGKMYHHTSDWNEDDADYGPIRKGESPVDFIQRAAKDAATRVLPPVRHNHDAIGVYGNCPACGTVIPPAEGREVQS